MGHRPRLWIDLFKALNSAQRLIYITGWSVFTQISLIRGEEAAEYEDSNVGELLKRKASEGVSGGDHLGVSRCECSS